MSKFLSFQILGIRESAGDAKVKAAHRKIMIANHPDQGGSAYVATKINEAKDCLLTTASGSGGGRSKDNPFSGR